nr:hypothetical protein [Tanacetum cinerariifolium]
MEADIVKRIDNRPNMLVTSQNQPTRIKGSLRFRSVRDFLHLVSEPRSDSYVWFADLKLLCTKHMTGNLKLLCNFVEKFLGTVRFGDQFALILGYGDLVQGNVTINRVYYVEGLNHNLFSVDQFCDEDLEVAFTTLTQAWLWHRRLSHLNFDYINLLSKKDIVIGLPKLKYIKGQLCSFYELSKGKRSSFKSKAVPSSKGRLNFLHVDLCGLMRIASINGKKYILVIVDDYSRYT